MILMIMIMIHFPDMIPQMKTNMEQDVQEKLPCKQIITNVELELHIIPKLEA